MAAAPLPILHQAILGTLGPPQHTIPTEKRARTRAHQPPHSIALSPDSTLRAFFPFRYSSIVNHHHHPHSHPPTQPPTPPHHLARGGPNRDPHFSSPPLQPTATLSAHRQPRHFQSFSPKIVLVATNRPARILGPSPHSFLVLADHTRDNRCGSFDSSEGVDTPARPGVPD